MRIIASVPLCVLVCMAAFGLSASAAQQSIDINSLQAGMRYCPAPWANNSEFLDTHYGMDAKTGQITKYTGTVHPDETGDLSRTGEQILYVAPPINVENRYVPYPGAAPQEPPAFLSQAQPRRVAQPAQSRRRQAPVTRPAPQPQQYRARPQASSGAPAPRVSAAPSRQSAPSRQKQPWWKAIWRN